MDAMLIVTIIGVAISTLGLAAAGLWAYNKSVQDQFLEMNKDAAKRSEDMDAKFSEGFKTIFRRVDENKESYWKHFVTKEVHDIQMQNINTQMANGFKNLSDKIDNLKETIKENKGD